MRIFFLFITAFSPFLYSNDNITPINDAIHVNAFNAQETPCESIVCNNMNKKEVPKVGYVPKRKGSESTRAISSVLYFVGDAQQTGNLPIDGFIDAVSNSPVTYPIVSGAVENK